MKRISMTQNVTEVSENHTLVNGDVQYILYYIIIIGYVAFQLSGQVD